MSDEQRVNGSGEPQMKVNDRRRFTADGEPLTSAQPEAATPEAPDGPGSPETTERDTQAARIDELTRALANLVEESKAARGRMEREKSRVLEAERLQLAQVLLEAVDELERVLGAAGDAAGPLVEGVRLTLASISKKIAVLGAVRISLVGERFDPRVAEAIDLVPVTDPEQDERVVQEVRAGYRIGNRVLRPASVRVGRLTRA